MSTNTFGMGTDDMRGQLHLVTADIESFMTQYHVRLSGAYFYRAQPEISIGNRRSPVYWDADRSSSAMVPGVAANSRVCIPP